MPFFEISKNPALSIFYLDQGSITAPAILLIHGACCDLHDWNWQVPLLLSLGYRVITPDLRGHGKSFTPLPTPDIRQWPGPDAISCGIVDFYPNSMGEDNIRLLDHLKIKSAIIMGHSLGTTVGYYMAAAHPDRVRAYIAIDPYHNRTGAEWDQVSGAFVENGSQVFLEWCDANAYNSVNAPAPWRLWWHRRRTLSTPDYVTAAVAIGGWEAEDSLGRLENATAMYRNGGIKCPLLIVGSAEQYVVLDRVLAEGVEGGLGEVHVVAEYDHWLHQDDGSERFNGILEAWLGKCGLIPKGEK
ncbi:Alpha/Beta hydrolase protein [Apodospora peruviana]|uniref:Alpha/Beta hydrolase protein n=1 Tax=Apodospora peruviana TaxID=516989 RepID=A0AAE0MGX9_9PEZI|nr:Alpha/Beta hydrolase protein [Apodospora peruviana]